MTDREKLIELLCLGAHKAEICNSHEDCSPAIGDCGFCTIIADHLLASGVRLETKQATESKREKTSEWISAKDALPEDSDTRVLVYINSTRSYTKMDTDRFNYCNCLWVRWGEDVTHWMPLPEPPKEVL